MSEAMRWHLDDFTAWILPPWQQFVKEQEELEELETPEMFRGHTANIIIIEEAHFEQDSQFEYGIMGISRELYYWSIVEQSPEYPGDFVDVNLRLPSQENTWLSQKTMEQMVDMLLHHVWTEQIKRERGVHWIKL